MVRGTGVARNKFDIEIEIEAEEQASVISASFILHAASRWADLTDLIDLWAAYVKIY